jgi:hypothetical protein
LITLLLDEAAENRSLLKMPGLRIEKPVQVPTSK